ncbi:MAG: PKD domain-containing protein [Planctomycetes bacterium]|nr:PKD domain-containing protein [Planctomycetota bacterium]
MPAFPYPRASDLAHALRAALALLCASAIAAAQTRQTLPAGWEQRPGNDRTLEPSAAELGQTWHWVYDNAQFQTRTPLAITALRLRPDEVASRWSEGTWNDLRLVLGRASTDYLRTSYPADFAAAFVPGSAQQVYRADLAIAAGEHDGAGEAPFVVEIPIDPPYRFDPSLGDDFVVELRVEGASEGLFALDARSGPRGSVGGNRYGDRTRSTASRWSYANDELVPVIEIEHYPDAGPIPEFAVDQRSGPSPLAVRFEDQSISGLPLVSAAWDFENDGVVDATGATAMHTYPQSGSYDVRLRVDDGVHPPRERVRTAWIDVDPAPRAAFEVASPRGRAPHATSFVDRSSDQPTAWAWDFENDGVVDSAAQHPTHVYSAPGLYDVRLVASNARGSSTVVLPASVAVVAPASVPFADGFETSALGSAYLLREPTLTAELLLGGARAGCAPHAGSGFLSLATAQSAGFARHSLDLVLDLQSASGASDLELRFRGWNQGEEADPGDRLLLSDDGVHFHAVLDLAAALQPARTWVEVVLDLDAEIARLSLAYADGFVVRFQREDDQSFAGGDGIALDALEIGPALTRAAFRASTTQGAAPLAVSFTDLSTSSASAPITSWSWDFDGDGLIDSNQPSPSFLYAFPGSYTVSLRVVDALARASEHRAPRLVRVGGVATVPFLDGFELGLLRPEWSASSSSPQGRVEASDLLGPAPWEGSWHAVLDRRVAGAASTQRLELHCDLSGQDQLELAYAIHASSDESDPEDGCWISDDGQRWALLQSHAGLPAHWTLFRIDLGEAIRAAGFAFSSGFRVRFQQRDDFPLPSDGICLDAVELRLPSGSTTPFGAGCAGGPGVPAIFSTGGLPYAGNPLFRLHLGLAAPNAPALLAVGLSRTVWPQVGLPLPFDLGLLGANGCALFTGPELLLSAATSPQGLTSIALPIPFAVGLPGFHAYAQWLVLDPQAPRPLPLVLSPGLDIRFGAY